MPLVTGPYRVAGDELLPGCCRVEVGPVIGIDVNGGADHLQGRRRRHRGLRLDDEEVVTATEDEEDDEDDREQAAAAAATETSPA
jgi:hypothetical protein